MRPTEHSEFECLDRHWALHQRFQILNAQMGICLSTWVFRFRMRRWALNIPPQHSDFECSDVRWTFLVSIQILNAQMGIWHSFRAFTFFKCLDVHWAFLQSIQISNNQMGFQMPIYAFEILILRLNAQCPSEHSKSECSSGMLNCHLSIRI